MFTDAPGRAAGSIIGLAAWAALAGLAAARYAGGERRWSRAATIGLAGLVAAGNVGLAAIHLKAGVGGVRPIVGAVLGVLALMLALTPTPPFPRGGGE
jgi:Kef-type K+ transport system membrane component KefB